VVSATTAATSLIGRDAVGTGRRRDGPDIGEIADAAAGEIPADNWGLPPDFDLKAYPHGTAEVSESGVDLSQLRNNLRLTPEERLKKMVRYARFFMQFRADTPRSRT
jgi:hypothetical protein